jgi:hypothetical protein
MRANEARAEDFPIEASFRDASVAVRRETAIVRRTENGVRSKNRPAPVSFIDPSCDAIQWAHRSRSRGTFETCRRSPRMSAYRGRSEVIGGGLNRRD